MHGALTPSMSVFNEALFSWNVAIGIVSVTGGSEVGGLDYWETCLKTLCSDLPIPLWYFHPHSFAFELKIARNAHNSSFVMPVCPYASTRDSLNNFSWNVIFESLQTFLYILEIWLNSNELSDLSSLVTSYLNYRLLQGCPTCLHSITLLLIRTPAITDRSSSTVMMSSFYS
jgi:hypothetical protein